MASHLDQYFLFPFDLPHDLAPYLKDCVDLLETLPKGSPHWVSLSLVINHLHMRCRQEIHAYHPWERKCTNEGA